MLNHKNENFILQYLIASRWINPSAPVCDSTLTGPLLRKFLKVRGVPSLSCRTGRTSVAAPGCLLSGDSGRIWNCRLPFCCAVAAKRAAPWGRRRESSRLTSSRVLYVRVEAHPETTKRPTSRLPSQRVAGNKAKYQHLQGGVSSFIAAIPKNPSGKLLRRRVLRDQAKKLD